MRVVVFGATGRTGLLVVRQALDFGHDVVAFTRSPAKLTLHHERLRVAQGDVTDAAQVDAAIAGTDAVVSVLGPASNRPDFAVSQGMTHILAAMQKHAVRRLVLSVGAGVRDPADRPKPIDRVFGFVLRRVSANVVADMERTVELVRASDRDWTIVRVPMLTDGTSPGTLKIGYVGDISPRLSRTDLAAFIVRQLADTTYLHKAPAISN